MNFHLVDKKNGDFLILCTPIDTVKLYCFHLFFTSYYNFVCTPIDTETKQ